MYGCQIILITALLIWQLQQKVYDFWSRAIVKRPLVLPNGSKTTCRRDWLCSPLTRLSSPPTVQLQSLWAWHPARTRATLPQGPRLSEHRISRTPRLWRSRRDRRQMGCCRKGIYQMGITGWLIRSNPNCQTSGCLINCFLSCTQITAYLETNRRLLSVNLQIIQSGLIGLLNHGSAHPLSTQTLTVRSLTRLPNSSNKGSLPTACVRPQVNHFDWLAEGGALPPSFGIHLICLPTIRISGNRKILYLRRVSFRIQIALLQSPVMPQFISVFASRTVSAAMGIPITSFVLTLSRRWPCWAF